MTDTLNDFWSQIGGSLADPVGDCGCALGSSREHAIDAALAVQRILAQYAALAKQAEALRQAVEQKVQVPCAVWSTYANARQDYLVKSQEVFKQLAAQNVTLEQVVYTDKGPKPDPDDPARVTTLRLTAPVPLPTFVNDQCAPGHLSGDLGWERTPISLGSIPRAALRSFGTAKALCLIGGDFLLGVATLVKHKTLKGVAVFLREYNRDLLAALTSYTTCLQAGLRAGTKLKDLEKQCSVPNAAPLAEAPANRSVWAILGAAVVAFAAGWWLYQRWLAPKVETKDAPVPAPARKHDDVFLGDLYWRPKRG